ncbi:MAG TPA: beta-N-acetylhexosaminidase [Dictyobacter sp.]|jgi:beta-N-acetylhexosaminidase|nr:beta-N-acetylhexosaminidase [Dictyobacter sp.]
MSQLTQNMTLEEQVGQLLVVGFPGTTVTPEITELIQKHHVGGIILFARNVASARQVQELTNQLQELARQAGHRYPLFIAIDQENGMVRRLGDHCTTFPGNMALGAIGSEEIAYEVALATGRELRALGINLNFAPVADVNNNPANPVIGIRSFGEDPQTVGKLTAAMVRGYHAAHVLTCLKHFPGHGDTAVDSHLSLPVIPHDLQRLEEIELVPFAAGFAAGTDSIMTAHISMPAFMVAGEQSATVSPTIIQGLLREKMGFTGLSITDCLEMKAISETIGVERGSVLALLAGNDLVLISHRADRQMKSIAAILKAVRENELASEMIEQATEHVLACKARTLAWSDLPDEDDLRLVNSPEHHQLRDRAYALSTTIVKNEDQLIPLRLISSDRLLVLFPQPENYTQAADKYRPAELLLNTIKQHHSNVEGRIIKPHPTSEQYQDIAQASHTFAIILVVTLNANLDSYQGELVHYIRQTGKPVIGLAVYNPYDVLAYPDISTYLTTYEYTQPALEAATRVLFGDASARGRLPVSIPGLYPLVP